MNKKYTYEQLKEMAREKFSDDRLNDLDYDIKYNREKSECPVGVPVSIKGETCHDVDWNECWQPIGIRCWQKRKHKGAE